MIELSTTPDDLLALPASDVPLIAVAVHAAAPAEGEEGQDRPEGPRPPVPTDGALRVLGDDAAATLLALGFEGGEAATVRLAGAGAAAGRTVMVVGLGPAAKVTTETVRRAAAAVVRASGDVTAVATDLAGVTVDGADATAVLGAAVEGALLGAYRFDTYRSKPAPRRLATVVLAGVDADAATDVTVARARAGAEAAMWVRDLVNTPPQDKRPPLLADLVVAGVADDDVTVRVLDEDALADGGYGGILGVGRGSSMKPRLVELRWEPEGAERHVALVGKGITFDSGGYSIKPTSGMETMKMDMAGAATAAAVVRAAARLRLPVAVSAVLALAENMISGDAQRVSDVIRMKDGTTVEVLNTDAEGRLVLGDALVHAVELGADTVVDIATLTGAVIVALGDLIGGVMANDDALAAELVATGRTTGEALWQLPLAVEEYGKRVEGSFADLRNVGSGRDAGTIFGALFLARFVPDRVRWAHLDIAGIAWRDNGGPYHQKGGTGSPARTLIAWLEGLAG